MTLRYTLVKQLHFFGQAGDQPVLVSMQRWDALRASRRRSNFVILHDGEPVMEKLYRWSVADLHEMDTAFRETEKQRAGAFFTEADARDLIRSRTGTAPEDLYCTNRHCGAPVPLGSRSHCEHGHPRSSVGSGAGGASPRRTIAYPIRPGGPQ